MKKDLELPSSAQALKGIINRELRDSIESYRNIYGEKLLEEPEVE